MRQSFYIVPRVIYPNLCILIDCKGKEFDKRGSAIESKNAKEKRKKGSRKAKPKLDFKDFFH